MRVMLIYNVKIFSMLPYLEFVQQKKRKFIEPCLCNSFFGPVKFNAGKDVDNFSVVQKIFHKITCLLRRQSLALTIVIYIHVEMWKRLTSYILGCTF